MDWIAGKCLALWGSHISEKKAKFSSQTSRETSHRVLISAVRYKAEGTADENQPVDTVWDFAFCKGPSDRPHYKN